jgi:phage-related protein
MLDNLGIIFDTTKATEEYAASLGRTAESLTDAEKKQAFINKALEVGGANLEAMGGVQETVTTKWERFKAKISDASIAVGSNFTPALGDLLDATNEIITAFDKWIKSDEIQTFFTNLSIDVVKAKAFMGEWVDNLKRIPSDIGDALSLAKNKILGNDEEIDRILDQREVDAWFRRREGERDLQEKINKIKADARARDKVGHEQTEEEKAEIAKKAAEKAAAAKEEAEKVAREKAAAAEKAHWEAVGADVETFISGGLESSAQAGVVAMTDTFLPGFGGAMGEVFSLLAQDSEAFQEQLNQMFSVEFVENILTNLTTMLEALPGLMGKLVTDLAEKMPDLVQPLVESLAIALGIRDGLIDAGDDIAEAFKKGIKDALKALTDIGGAVGGTAGTFTDVLSGTVGAVAGGVSGGLSSGLSAIGLAHGGEVPAPRPIRGYAHGGIIDNTLIAATQGEMVVNRASTQANRGLLEEINNSQGRAVSGGNVINITVNGGMLGDKNEARQFARAIDTELMELRQGGESRAFDEGLF